MLDVGCRPSVGFRCCSSHHSIRLQGASYVPFVEGTALVQALTKTGDLVCFGVAAGQHFRDQSS